MAKRQSTVYRRKAVPRVTSELELSVEVRRGLGVDIEPARLAKFICDRFVILSILCHEIHEAEKNGAP